MVLEAQHIDLSSYLGSRRQKMRIGLTESYYETIT